MKKNLAKFWQKLKKILVWADDHKFKTLLLLIVLILAIYGISYLFSIKLTNETVSLTPDGRALSIGTIDNSTGDTVQFGIKSADNPVRTDEVLVYQNAEKALYINTDNTNITIVDKATGTYWDTEALSVLTYDNTGTVNAVDDNYASPFIINTVGNDGSTSTMDAYKYSIADKQFTIDKILNGVQVTYQLQDKTFNIFEHLPREISYANYDAEIGSKLQGLVDNGTITETDLNNFNMLWASFYAKTPSSSSWFYKNNSQPPISAANLMVKIIDAVGYTQEDLINDNESFGLVTTITPKTIYTVVIDTTLDDNDMVVNVPTAYSTSNDSFYNISSISVYPYFGDMNNKLFAGMTNPGYIFVPDGPGALINLNDNNVNYSSYSKPVYNNDAYDKYYLAQDAQSQNINMPVFGMYGNTGSSSKGFLGIIESGAQTATINASSAKAYRNTSTIKNITSQADSVNQVNAQFSVVQLSSVPLYGFYASDTTAYLSQSVKYDFDATIRYKLLAQPTISYYDLAQLYRNYLINTDQLSVNYSNFKPQIFIDLLGDLTIQKHILGVPYNTDMSMTTYTQAMQIMQDLSGVSKVVNYLGTVNGGLEQSLLTRINLAAANGTFAQYEALNNYLTSTDSSLYANLNFTDVYKNGKNGFSAKNNGIYALDSTPLELYQFDLATGQFNMNSTPKYVLSPSYLSSEVNQFIAHNQYFNNITLDDLGSTYLVDYNKHNTVTPFQAAYMENENIKKLSQYNLILNNPNIDYVQYATYVENLSRQSSNEYIFAASIPFEQLVLNGIVQYSTENVNLNSSESPQYYLLEALELGSDPQFTLSYQDTSILKNTEYNGYYSTQYETWDSQIKTMYNEYKSVFNQIGTNHIINSEMLAANVFKTTYATGYAVIVNYNDYAVSADNHTVDPMGYYIESGVNIG